MIESVIRNQTGIDAQYNQLHFADSLLELIHVTAGRGNVIINGEIYPLAPETVYLIDGSYPHCTVPAAKPTYVRSKIFFRKPALTGILQAGGVELNSLFPADGKISVLPLDQSAVLESRIKELAETPDTDELKRMELAIGILRLVNEGSSEEPERADSLLSEVFQYIHANISGDLSIESIAKAAHVNPYYLCHKFRKATNMTVGQHIKKCRISKAKQLLSDSTLTVSDVSCEAGFENFSHFSKVFREMTGMTPSAFRTQCKMRQDDKQL